MNHVPVFIPLVFFLGALLIPLAGRGKGGRPYAIMLGATAAAWALSVGGLCMVLEGGTVRYYLGGWMPPIGIELVLDPLSAFMTVLVVTVALLVLIHSREVVDRELPGKAVPFYSSALLLMGGLVGIVITGDLFNLYVFLEISSLAGYALVAMGDRRAPVSAFRYLILGSVGASFYLLGLGFIFLVGGSLNMADVADILPLVGQSPTVLVGAVLVTMGLGLKMALFPLHGWLPDAYTHASSTATALIAPIGTKVAAYVMIRFFFYVFDPETIRSGIPLADVVGYLGAAGILCGSVMAMAQRDLKRMLAYSSVGQIGYIALGIGLASPYGLIGAILHALNHAVMKAGLFLVSANWLKRLGHVDVRRLDSSVRLKTPWTSAAFAVAAISMIGLPPTAGFFSKWYLVLGAVERRNWIFVGVILASSLMSAVYFFRVLEKVFLQPPAPAGAGESGEAEVSARPAGRAEVPWAMLAPTLILAGALLVLGLGNVLIVERFIKLMLPPGL